jgi:hypothetical protein
LKQTLDYLKLENSKAEQLMKMVRTRERALNTAVKIANEVLQPLMDIGQGESIWKKLPYDEFKRHYATICVLMEDKSETVEQVMGKTMRSMSDTQLSSTLNQF